MDAITTIMTATTGRELFSKNGKQAYQRLAKAVHPDTYTGPDPDAANEAFARLSKLWADFQSSVPTDTLKTAQREYRLTRINNDGVFERFAATYDDGHKRGFIVIAKNPADNDLVQRYSEVVEGMSGWVPDNYSAFYPTAIERLSLGQGADRRQGVAFAYPLPDGFYSLREVHEDYPEGIDGRDAVWIFKRILIALGNAHDVEVIHGAVNLDTIFIHPEQHGLVLDGWGYSVDDGEKLKAIPPKFKREYPDELFTHKTPTKTLDIQLAARTMLTLMGTEPKRLRRFFNALLSTSVPHPSILLAEFNALTEEIYGPPKFNVFRMRRDQ